MRTVVRLLDKLMPDEEPKLDAITVALLGLGRLEGVLDRHHGTGDQHISPEPF
jgi:hypothetical protein